MDLTLIVVVVVGAIAGNLAGVAFKRLSLGFAGNSLAGAVGAVVAVYFLLGDIVDRAAAQQGTDVPTISAGQLLMPLFVVAVCAVVVTWLVGLLKLANSSK